MAFDSVLGTGIAIDYDPPLTFPFATDVKLPHTWEIAKEFLDVDAAGATTLERLARAALFTLRNAVIGFTLGSVFGLGLAIRSCTSGSWNAHSCPNIVASQTIPIIAIAPLIVIGLKADWFGVAIVVDLPDVLPRDHRRATRATRYDPRALELMRSYAASRGQILRKLRLPAARPYLFTGFRIAAPAAVVGSIVGELPSLIQDGLARQIITGIAVLLPQRRVPVGGDRRLLGAGHRRVSGGRGRRERDAPPRAARRRGRGSMTESAGTRRPVVEIAGVSKTFAARGNATGSVEALVGIDLIVARGEFVSLIGPSGCGKSTLLRIIGDLTSPTAGTVTVNGKAAPQARLDRDYGMVFQAPILFDWRRSRRTSSCRSRSTGRPRPIATAARPTSCDLVELADFARHYPWQLSGGMQQRVAIARALAVDPAILLMDEPFGALDEMTRERMNLELLKIWERTGTTIVFVTHSIAEAVFLSTRVVVMSARPGRISAIVDIDLPRERNVETREMEQYFHLVTEVREALRGDERGTGAATGPAATVPMAARVPMVPAARMTPRPAGSRRRAYPDDERDRRHAADPGRPSDRHGPVA